MNEKLIQRICISKDSKVSNEPLKMSVVTHFILTTFLLRMSVSICLILPRHSSFTINHSFVNLGRVRHNMAEGLANTTVSTTTAHRQNGDKGKCVGRNT